MIGIEHVGIFAKDTAALKDKGVGVMFFRDPEGNILHLIYREKPLQ